MQQKQNTVQFIKYFPLKYIEDERGSLMHFLKNTDEYFQNFGECYVSWTNPGFVKGWYKHKKTHSLLTSPTANLKMVFYDNRQNSRFYGTIDSLEIRKNNYGLVSIPPGVWYSFKAANEQPSIIINCLDSLYEAEEVDRLPIGTEKIPFIWGNNV